jgi:hypothetical protein
MPKAKHAHIKLPKTAAVPTAARAPLIPVVPTGMPSIWQLALLAKQCTDESARIEAIPSLAWAGPLAQSHKDAALDFILTREDAIVSLAETLPARNLRDALVLIAFADKHLDTLDGCVNPPPPTASSNEMTWGRAREHMREAVDRLQRIVSNAAPIIARAAGVALAEIDCEHLEGRRAVLFAPEIT